MAGKAKPKKRRANCGGAKYECPHCKVTTPDIKSMQIHHDARHRKFPLAGEFECKLTIPDIKSMQIHPKFPLDENKKKDQLSSLPDDILINNLLSHLPMLEAQQTSVLARRWRYLWSYVPCLDLDGSQKLPDDQITDKISAAYLASKYAKWVDQTIDAYRGTTTTALRHFRVLFDLDYTYDSKIDSWLEFSFRQGVEVLELDFYPTLRPGRPWYTFRSVEPCRFPNIRLLKSLTLKAVYMPDDSLKDLLLAFEFLERLHLAHVDALTRVNVTGPVSRLKHIHIDSCYDLRSIMIQAPTTPDLVSFTYPGHYPERLDLADVDGLPRVNVTGPVSTLKHIHIDNCNELESIMIQAPTPDLVSFTYPCRNVEITLQHAPQLVDLRLYLSYTHSTDKHPLFRYLPQLEALHLVYHPRDMEGIYPWHDFPILSHLKHLRLDFNGRGRCIRDQLCGLPWLLERASFLQHLTVEVDAIGPLELKEIREVIYPWHDFPVLSRLKHLTLDLDGRGRCIRDRLCGLAWLIERAPFLQRLTVDVGRLCEWFEIEETREELADVLLGLRVRVLEISGFRGFRDGDCELALHLIIRASESLEKLIIDHRSTIPERGWQIHRGTPDPYKRFKNGRKGWERRVREVIEPELPSKVKLVLI